MANENNVHKNHRERLRIRAINSGLQDFYDHQLLELLLFYALPRIDTNDLAHSLIERFGSLEGVFKADRNELLSVSGIGSNSCGPQLFERYRMMDPKVKFEFTILKK